MCPPTSLSQQDAAASEAVAAEQQQRQGSLSKAVQEPSLQQRHKEDLSRRSSLLSLLCQLNIRVVLYAALVSIAIQVLPKSLIVNRGFTVWFQYIWILYLALGKPPKLEPFGFIVGCGVCVGWYSSLVVDMIFIHPYTAYLLYDNMLPVMKSYMFIDHEHGNGSLAFDSSSGILMMILSHILDSAGHIGITYYFYKKCIAQQQELTTAAAATTTTKSQHPSLLIWLFQNHEIPVISWTLLILSYCFSRIWSIVHTYEHYQTFGMFYFGTHVYHVATSDLFYPSYIGEAIVFGLAVGCKLYYSRIRNCGMGTKILEEDCYDIIDNHVNKDPCDDRKPPRLLHSDSTMSSTSSVY